MVARTFLLIAAALTGCSSVGLPFSADGGSPKDVPTGIYRLTIQATSDSCDPPRATGDLGEVPLLNHPPDVADEMRVFVAVNGPVGVRSEQAVSLPTADGYSSSSPIINACDNALFHGEFQLLGATGNEVSVDAIEEWTVNRACDGNGLFSLASSKSCRAERVLTYSLVTACEPPKRIVDDIENGSLRLRCVD